MKNTDEELRRRIQEFRPIDDTFFEVLADDVAFCQEILRVILEDPGKKFEKVSNVIFRSLTFWREAGQYTT